MIRASARRTGCVCWVVVSGGCVTQASLGSWTQTFDINPRDAGTSALIDSGMHMSFAGAGNSAMTMPVPTPMDGGQDVCDHAIPPICQINQNLTLPLELTADPFGMTRFFGDGAQLPAGEYQIEYIGGCVKYGDVIDPTSHIAGYTVHAGSDAAASGLGAFWLVSQDGTLLTMTPGTRGILTGQGAEPFGAFQNYASCVEANCMLPVENFMFEGGPLGIYQNPALNQSQATPPAPGEESPTFRLSRRDCSAQP